MKNKNYFTLVEIMIVVAIIGLLAAIAVPNFMKARETSRKNACIGNLKQIEAAKEQAALEKNLANDTAVANSTLVSYIKGAAVPTCPAGGSYTVNNIGTDAVCDYGHGHNL